MGFLETELPSSDSRDPTSFARFTIAAAHSEDMWRLGGFLGQTCLILLAHVGSLPSA